MNGDFFATSLLHFLLYTVAWLKEGLSATDSVRCYRSILTGFDGAKGSASVTLYADTQSLKVKTDFEFSDLSGITFKAFTTGHYYDAFPAGLRKGKHSVSYSVDPVYAPLYFAQLAGGLGIAYQHLDNGGYFKGSLSECPLTEGSLRRVA